MTDRTYLEKAYKLKQNPFANRVDPNVDMAGRLEEKKKWTRIIDDHISSNANLMCFVVGDYGYGKTLTLSKIVEQYQDHKEVLPIFIKMLPEDRISKFGVDFIQRLFRRIPREILESFSLEAIDALQENYFEPAKIFRRIALKGEGGIDYLHGQRGFTATELKKFGVKRKMDRTEIAKEYLLSFLYLLGTTSKKILLIAVDETEYVFSQMTGANIAMVFNTLRDLYDLTTSRTMPLVPGPPANMIFFFAISSAGWDQLNDLGRREAARPGPIQPLLRRIVEQQIQLSPLSQEEAKELIEKRLSRNRVSGQIEREPLIPFDESFVSFVYKLSNGGNPSDIVKYCDAALMEGLYQQVTLLNADFAKQAFVAHGLIVNPNY